MKLLAKAFAIGLAVSALSVACAAAASLGLASNALSAGNAAVTSCTTSLKATRTVDNSGNVTQVDVGSIPAACAGATLSVTLVGSSNASLGSASGTVPTGGGTVSLSGFGTVAASSLTGYAFAVVGA